tara:strand:- start:725 stop:880 length:156 start_codon:yes stop_codon:yes gene_type:complete
MAKCTNCKTEIIWLGDHSYEDYRLEDEGIVSNYLCPNDECSVESILTYKTL